MKAPLPQDEAARLDVLHQYAILDTDPEAAFDDFTRLAAHICGTSIALVSLIDDCRQWFKSKVGLEAQSTSRDIAFCSHAIHQPDQVLIVPDTRLDQRFATNPLVISHPHIRFYAGAPLITPEGYAIGTLCVIDQRPRQLTPEQVESLQALSRQVITQLELRRNLIDLTQMTTRLQQAEQTRVQLLAQEQAARAAAEAAHNQVTNILESITDAFFALDNQWRFTYLNQQAELLMHRTREELLGKELWDEFPEAADSIFYQKYHQAVAQQVSLEFEAFYAPFDQWLEVHAYPSPDGLSIYFRNITERKQIAQTLQRAANENLRLARAINSVSNGVVITDPHQADNPIIYINPAFLRMTRYSLNEVLGRNCRFLQGSETDPRAIAEIRKAIAARKELQITLLNYRKDGQPFWNELKLAPVLSEGELLYFVGVQTDVSDRYTIERMKDEFIAVVSHELRTPLTSIRGALGLLASGFLHSQPEKGQRMLDIAVSNTDRLVRLINDILDIERIESGKVVMAKQTCEVTYLIQQATDALQPLTQAGITLSISSISDWVWADPDRIIQTLTNLLSNAIKFSPRGATVWLRATRQDEKILFQVQDQGRGIPADRLEAIFGRFQQVDASDSRKKGGTGLGLAICRSIVQQHGGRIWAESTLGEGSTFSFVLPALRETTLPPEIANGPQVLLCDDDASIRTVVKTMLEQQGYQVVAVGSGEQAVEQATRSRPDVILLNLVMPQMNGWETMATLKERATTSNIPIILISGLHPDQQSPPPDVIDWIVKPPDERRLFQALERALLLQGKQARVLIVEDDLDLARVLVAMFERHGIQTFHARTGHEAIQLSQTILPDLLVLDLVLPEGDGFAVVDWLRHHNRLCQVPLVVYTAADLGGAERQRLKLGQTLFLTKGRISSQEFEQQVISLLRRVICVSKDSSGDKANVGD